MDENPYESPRENGRVTFRDIGQRGLNSEPDYLRIGPWATLVFLLLAIVTLIGAATSLLGR